MEAAAELQKDHKVCTAEHAESSEVACNTADQNPLTCNSFLFHFQDRTDLIVIKLEFDLMNLLVVCFHMGETRSGENLFCLRPLFS